MKCGKIRTKIATLNCLLYLTLLLQEIHSLSSEIKYRSHTKATIASSIAKTERRENERSLVGREICGNCNRPPVLCICKSLPPKLISTNTNVLVLQHPREFRRKSLSTVPLMPLVLEKCTIKVGYNFTPDKVNLVQECLDRGQKPLLLFPGPSAINLDKEADDNDEVDLDNFLQNQKKGEPLLILIDGTWAEAKRMIMQSPELIEVCQQVQFSADNKSIYDVVRKEPEKHCISTLEACAHTLMLLESEEECALQAKKFLEGSMRCMVETKMQVSQSRNPEPRFTRPNEKLFKKNKRRFEIKKEVFGD